MLQNLKPNKRKETSLKRWNRVLRHFHDTDYTHYKFHEPELMAEYFDEEEKTVLGYKRFIKYQPTKNQYTPDNRTDFTGVYILSSDYGNTYPFRDITTCTNSYSNGYYEMYGVCDNASQVLDLYDAVFNDAPYKDTELVEMYKRNREFDLTKYAEKPDNKWTKQAADFWKGNHVIILNKMDAFRWHKWGPYIGKYEPSHEDFSEEPGIDFVYAFSIYKVV